MCSRPCGANRQSTESQKKGRGRVTHGTTTCASMPRSLAARATAMPWLPDDCVTTPLAAASSLRLKIAFVAPRILKDPVRWKLSHLKKRL
jgi:acyl dehydratase